jgi:GntR family transcriptional regulator / MocR family aminotransferase
MSTGPLLELALDRGRPLGLQVEEQIRALVRSQSLPVGAELPSTRALAADLGLSRGVVVGAYAQLAAEGYIRLRRGAAPVVAAVGRAPVDVCVPAHDVPIAESRYVLRPDLPDLALFPRAQWLTSGRAALHAAADTDLAYGEPFGAVVLRRELAPFLARTRGVVAAVDRTAVFAGSTHALHTLAVVLRSSGVVRIGVEDPGHRWRTRALAAAGVDVVPVPVDEHGLRVDRLGDVDAVVASPEHGFPTGATLSAERRRALVEWAVAGDRLVLEHDYDGHFRYDRPATGSLQAMAPEHVAYVGSASALLAPTVRLGWAVLPARFVEPVATRLFATGVALPRLAQLTLADFTRRGYLDRHLRRARTAYARRRAVAIAALERSLPDAVVGGAAAGLFVHVALPPGTDEPAVLAAARSRGVAIDGVNEHTLLPSGPGLALGFAALAEPALERAVEAVAAAFTAATA